MKLFLKALVVFVTVAAMAVACAIQTVDSAVMP